MSSSVDSRENREKGGAEAIRFPLNLDLPSTLTIKTLKRKGRSK